MSWTNIPNGNLAIGAPIRSIDQLALRDNPIAIAEGATGAPRVRAEALNGGQSGTAPIYAARAWVNFDGTTAGANPAPMTIRGSGNVSSVTRNSTGVYTVNFTTAMPDTNYSVIGTTGDTSTLSAIVMLGTTGTPPSFSTTNCRVITTNFSNTLQNKTDICLVFLR
jgi:hypothetical protein